VPATGQRPRRPAVLPQHHYWRRTETELHAAAAAVFPPFIPLGPVFSASATMGPTAAGEWWSVGMVQVQTNVGVGDPPLVAKQVQGQISGTTTNPPPPVTAQVWLSAAGVNLHLLGQTSQGSYDNIGLGGQEIRAGEAITVTWWLAAPFFGPDFVTGAWAVLRGTRHALSQI